MADRVLMDATVDLNGSDVSDYVKSVALNINVELVDNTAMGDSTRQKLPGLKDSSVTIEFQQDYAVGLIDNILFALLGVSVAVKVRADSGAISTSNPEYQVTGYMENYNPIAGAVGERAMSSVTIQGSGAVVRDTVP